MGMLTGVGTQREYERNGAKTKMVAMELDYDGLVFFIILCKCVIGFIVYIQKRNFLTNL